MKTVIGLYDDRNDAQQVQQELTNSGFDRGQIDMMQNGNVKSSLTSAGVPNEEADLYAEGVRRGGTLVTANVDDSRTNEAVDIMNRYDPVDIHNRSSMWRDEGWTSYDETAEPYAEGSTERDYQRYRENERTMDTTNQRNVEGEQSIPVVEEEMTVGKRQTQSGGVRVRSYMREVPVEEQVTLREEHVNVERRNVNRDATAADLDNFREGTIEMTETSEEAVVTKDARVVEEVTVGKSVEQHTETIRDTIRRTEVDVERIPAGERQEFRRDYEQNFADTEHDYEDTYEPAYSYGYTLANDDNMSNTRWEDVEPQARQRWERDHDSAWDDVKDAVRRGWNRVRS